MTGAQGLNLLIFHNFRGHNSCICNTTWPARAETSSFDYLILGSAG